MIYRLTKENGKYKYTARYFVIKVSHQDNQTASSLCYMKFVGLQHERNAESNLLWEQQQQQQQQQQIDLSPPEQQLPPPPVSFIPNPNVIFPYLLLLLSVRSHVLLLLLFNR